MLKRPETKPVRLLHPHEAQAQRIKELEKENTRLKAERDDALLEARYVRLYLADMNWQKSAVDGTPQNAVAGRA